MIIEGTGSSTGTTDYNNNPFNPITQTSQWLKWVNRLYPSNAVVVQGQGSTTNITGVYTSPQGAKAAITQSGGNANNPNVPMDLGIIGAALMGLILLIVIIKK